MVPALAAPELSTGWHLATQRRRTAWLVALGVLASLIAAGLVLLFEFVPVGLLLAWLLLATIAWRPRVGVYVAVALVVFFEALSMDPLMLPGRYLYVGYAGSVISPLELLVLLTFVSWLVQGIARRRLDFRGGRLFWPMLLFFVALVFGMVRGALGGGDLYVAFWEARWLFVLVLCYVLAANTVRTRRHLGTLMAVMLLATGLFAVEGVYRHVALIGTGRLQQHIDHAWGHEDVIFLSALLLLVLAQQVVGAPRRQRLLTLLIVPVAVFTLLATQRRAGYICLIVAFLALSVVFLMIHRKAFFLFTVPMLVGAAIYLPLFWNNAGLLGQPARAIRSLITPDARDAESNYYRELEKINVRATIEADPLLGIGFGREFLFVVPLPDLSSWPFWRYQPHNTILWIWLKTGVVGFVLFWILMGTAIARAARFARTLRDPTVRIYALLSLGVVTSSLVFCYVDTGLYFGRFTLFLGTNLGALAVLDRLDGPGALDEGTVERGPTATSTIRSARVATETAGVA